MRVVQSTLAHLSKRRFNLIESIVDERVIAPNVNERVLFCANQKQQQQQQQQRGQQHVRNRSHEFVPIVQKKGETNTYLC